MRDINLIPRKPWVEKYFVLLCLLMLLCIVTPIGWMIQSTQAKSEEADDLTKQIEQRQFALDELRILKAADELTLQYEQWLSQIEKVLSDRTDWAPVISAIATPLPASSSLRLVEASSSGLIRLTLHFDTYAQIDRYVRRLEQSPYFHTNLLSVRNESSSEQYVANIELVIKTDEQKAADVQ